MKYVIGAVLIAVGGYLIYLGNRRADSIAGIAEKTGKDIANAFDGKTRTGQSTYYYIGGGVLIAAGAFVALKKKPFIE
jgi:LPXTG-motif cell wall-anchored protein